MNVLNELFKYADVEYKTFHKKLIPNVSEEKIIGVRIPQLRKIAKCLDNDDFGWDYYEEIILHGFYIGYKKLDLAQRLKMLEEFIPKIDNWAVCDCVCSTLKFVKKNQAEFLDFLQKYMYSDKEYDVRFAVITLMDYYLDDEYIDYTLNYLKNIRSEYYYVNMGAAWAFCTAFSKYKDKVLPLLENRQLSSEIHNMTISKIRDSYRVDKATKEYLKTLRA